MVKGRGPAARLLAPALTLRWSNVQPLLGFLIFLHVSHCQRGKQKETTHRAVWGLHGINALGRSAIVITGVRVLSETWRYSCVFDSEFFQI